ncbi:hypothetical protein JW826_00545 [Candidatus Woesearchaeota archaeon]|nr:hypothetical protein [Candidatus Woesearchaeota archaeon]
MLSRQLLSLLSGRRRAISHEISFSEALSLIHSRSSGLVNIVGLDSETHDPLIGEMRRERAIYGLEGAFNKPAGEYLSVKHEIYVPKNPEKSKPAWHFIDFAQGRLKTVDDKPVREKPYLTVTVDFYEKPRADNRS